MTFPSLLLLPLPLSVSRNSVGEQDRPKENDDADDGVNTNKNEGAKETSKDSTTSMIISRRVLADLSQAGADVIRFQLPC